MIYENKILKFASEGRFVCKYAILALHKYTFLYILTVCYLYWPIDESWCRKQTLSCIDSHVLCS